MVLRKKVYFLDCAGRMKGNKVEGKVARKISELVNERAAKMS
jgi:hypothetical protein